MKKLLTVLLTLVMAVCLSNLKKNVIRADSNNIVSCNETSCTISKQLYFDGTDLKWTGDGAVLSPTEKTQLGISLSGSTITLNKSIHLENENEILLYIEMNGDVTINLNNDISLTEDYGSDIIDCWNKSGSTRYNVTINGNNHKLTLESDYDSNAMYLGDRNLILNDVIVKGGPIFITDYICGDKNNTMSINGTSEVHLHNASGLSSLLLEGNLDIQNGCKIFGSNDGKNYSSVIKNASNEYILEKNNENATDIKIVEKNPTPKPSPSEPVVKDESCEKVIGPTWHWNNTKGICEEYATVGTATR